MEFPPHSMGHFPPFALQWQGCRVTKRMRKAGSEIPTKNPRGQTPTHPRGSHREALRGEHEVDHHQAGQVEAAQGEEAALGRAACDAADEGVVLPPPHGRGAGQGLGVWGGGRRGVGGDCRPGPPGC